ncbi:hypothetical protein QWM81_06585 [Streptomyces ficellus]|uniref:AbiEi antitoxin C-terminal domain-containing protein n=1 Tax=Streptomyces ficellus TaxID=1977088 RepID=A0ABT7Z2J5_9ACTN|nr:hypothetical protein [Streptomyces ficellus]MDN3293715.1 hypothetical protein [Streptomyces ficellus]
MPTPTPPYARLATDPLVVAQDGVATVHQLMDLGCASSAVAALCRPPGPWRRLLPRVVLLHTGAPSPRQRLRGALLYAGPDALLTGPAALALHGVPHDVPFGAGSPPPQVDVLVTHRAGPRSHAYVRVRPTLRPARRVPVSDLPCASLPRAVTDSIPHLDGDHAITTLLTEVTRHGLCAPGELLAELQAAQLMREPWVAAILRGVTDT